MHTSVQASGSRARFVFNGRSLAHRKKKLSRKQRANIAASVIERSADFVPTQEQLAQILNVPVRDIQMARNGHAHKQRKPTLAEMLQRATPEERATAVRTLGPEWMYDNIVVLL
jgi:hypothetical protein